MDSSHDDAASSSDSESTPSKRPKIEHEESTDDLAVECFDPLADCEDGKCQLKSPRKRNKWPVEILEEALQKLRDSSYHHIFRETGVPYHILHKYHYDRIKDVNFECPHIKRFTVFTPEQEKLLTNPLRGLSNIFHGVTEKQFRSMIFEIADRLNVEHKLRKLLYICRRGFINDILRRHPDITMRKPKGKSNEDAVSLFLDNFTKLVVKHNVNPQLICNVDETTFPTDLKTKENNVPITMICAVNAAGCFVTPLIVFPQKHSSLHLMQHRPPGAVYTFSDDGKTSKNIFVMWLQHFIKQAKPTAESPVLLLLDNDYTHISVEAWELAKEKNVIMLAFPPETSDRLQPLEFYFNSLIKSAYKKEYNMYMKSTKSKEVSPTDMAGFLYKAYTQVIRKKYSRNAFKNMGVYPMNLITLTDPSDTCSKTNDDEEKFNSVNSDVSVLEMSCETPFINTAESPVDSLRLLPKIEPFPSLQHTSRGTAYIYDLLPCSIIKEEEG